MANSINTYLKAKLYTFFYPIILIKKTRLRPPPPKLQKQIKLYDDKKIILPLKCNPKYFAYYYKKKQYD